MSRKSPGEGSVSQRKDGRWQASLQVDGVRKTVYGKAEREVRRMLADLRRQADAGSLPNPGNRTVDDLLDLWLETAKGSLKPTTVAWYTTIAAKHARPKLGKLKLSKLEPAHVQGLCSGLEGRIGVALYSTPYRACEFGVLWRWLPANPCERVFKPSHQAPRKDVLNHEELRAFLAGTSEHWLASLWTVAVATGCRVGEMLALEWRAVDLAAGSITVRGNLQRANGEWLVSTPKTRAGERGITLPAEGVAALKRHKAQQAEWKLRAGPEWQASDLVFTGETGRPLGRWTVEHAMDRACDRLGLPKVTPHGLRHLHASLLLDAGLPVPAVSARLGHAKPSITMAIYAHKVGEDDRQAADVLARALAR